MRTTERACLDALREAAERLGESPTREQYDELGLTPAAGTIMRTMGGWNAAKEEAGLETYSREESGGMPVDPKPNWVEIPEGVEWEELSGQQRWYYKNRRDRIERKERRRKELRLWLHDLKRDELGCERCGEDRPPALDFHHPGEKELGVSEMVSYGYSRESIRKEIEGCVVLCANCHRVEHYSVPQTQETDRVL